jgi:hypothetical protein
MSDPKTPIEPEILPPLSAEEDPAPAPATPTKITVRYTAQERSENARLAAREKSRNDKGLTKKQALLVDIMLSDGIPASQAARKAGYRDGPGLRVQASRTLSLPKVQAYLREQLDFAMLKTAVKAKRRLSHLIDHAKSEFVQLQAADSVLDRAGIQRKPAQDAPTLSIDIDLS